MNGPRLGPGALADRLLGLPLAIDSVEVELGTARLQGYDEGLDRPTAVVSLGGAGITGRGECVAWSESEQARFAAACPGLAPPGRWTLNALHEEMASADPYHAAAIEAAAIDLALRQVATNPFALSDRPARSVAICRSLGLSWVTSTGGPQRAVRAVLAGEPWARIKIDVAPGGWKESDWMGLARTGHVVIVDFKRRGAIEQVELAHRHLPDAWLEDPPSAALVREAPWRPRIALDGYVGGTADLASLAIEPGAVNVKPARVGGPIEALRLLEECSRRSWEAYIGGMFEAGPGRRQARVLASLFTAEAWNDLAPIVDESARAGSLPMRADFLGFDPGTCRTPNSAGARSRARR